MKKISRRDFLKVTGLMGAAAALTACGGSASSTAASTASSAAGSAAASYYTDYVSVLVEDSTGIKGLADLKDKVVGVSSGSTSARALVKAMIDEGVLDGANFDADTFNADTWKDGISFRQYDDYPAISTALSAGEVQGFCVDKSILAIYKTEGRSYIDAEFSPQEYGVATKKGSDFSTLCDDLVKGWLADGTIEQLIKDNGLD